MNKLKFKYGNGCFEFEVEGDDDFVKEKTEWATSLVSQTQNRLNEITEPSSNPQEQIQYLEAPVNKEYSSPIQFLLDKNFSSDMDVTLGLAYYMEKYDGKNSWNISDLQDMYSLAKKKLPSNLSHNISGNISKGFFINPNRDEKRTYCLTPEGEIYVETYTSKGKDNTNKPKNKKSISKPMDPEELEKIDNVKQDLAKYDETIMAVLENIKGQKDQTLLGAYLIYLRFGENYDFTPKIISALLKKLAIALDGVQAIKVISANSKFFDNVRRGWYILNEIGVKYIKNNILTIDEA